LAASPNKRIKNMSKTRKTSSVPCLSRHYKPLGLKAVVAAITASASTGTTTTIGKIYPAYFLD